MEEKEEYTPHDPFRCAKCVRYVPMPQCRACAVILEKEEEEEEKKKKKQKKDAEA